MTFEGDMFFSLVKTLLTVLMTLLLVFALTDFKYSRPKILAAFSIYILYVIFAAWFCINWLGWTGFMRSCIITIFVPAFLLTYFAATDHAMQAVFNYATQFNIGLILSATGTLFNTAIHGNKITDLVIRVILFTAVILLEYRFIRPPFRRVAETLSDNWRILAAVPVCFAILLLACGLFPIHFTKSVWSVIHIYLAALAMLVVYGVVFRSLNDSCAVLEAQRQNDILAAQTAALENHADSLIQQAEREAVFCNNVHYYTQAIYAMMRNGDADRVVEYLGSLDTEYAQATPKHYCNHTPLNDILSFYLERARRQGITVETNLYFPAVLPVDAIELATVFCNAIDNAIESMAELPDGEEKRLEFICTDKPEFIFEIASTCPNRIHFNSDGVPVNENGQPGIRTRSILAFAHQHHTVLDYAVSGGMFRLRLLIKET